MTTTLLIARHGNTFGPGETPTRVGARTDLPLVESGREQARKLGRYLKEKNLVPDMILTSDLKRTQETAELIKAEIGVPIETHALAIFNEIDYGPDENKTDDETEARIGKYVLAQWNEEGIAPQDWIVDTNKIITNWQNFANEIENDSRVLVITSNGIARFSPYLTGNFEAFRKTQKTLKILTGALCILERSGSEWKIRDWNIKP